MEKVKSLVGFILGVFFGALIVCFVCHYFWQIRYVAEFDVDDYCDEIQTFPSDLVFGPVRTKREAKQIAFDVFSEMTNTRLWGRPRDWGVCYDNENHVWMVAISFADKRTLGGSLHIIIREDDGAVLARWGYK